MNELLKNRIFIYLVVTAIFLLALPWLAHSAYAHHLMIMMGLAIILAASNRLIFVSGAWFMGHAAFYAIGAYGLVLLRSKAGLNFWMALPMIGLVAGLVAIGLGYATSRVKGIPFCLITVAFVEVVRLTIIKTPYLGGHRALRCPPPEGILGIDFSSKIHYYYLILILVVLTLLLLYLIEKSPVGASLKTIAENEALAESVGINTVRYKVLTMSLCAFFGGLAGGFYAPYVAVTGPTSFTLLTSIIILVNVVVGGIGNIWGPVAGAIFLTLLPEFLPGKAGYQNILYAAIVLASLFFLPEGLVSLPDMVNRKIGWRLVKRRGSENRDD
jgi:branched-chain amino acid transport system permease protein